MKYCFEPSNNTAIHRIVKTSHQDFWTLMQTALLSELKYAGYLSEIQYHNAESLLLEKKPQTHHSWDRNIAT